MSKRLMIVPAAFLEELKMSSAHPLPQPLEVTAAVNMGDELKRILDRTDITEDMKREMYSQALIRYRNVLGQAKSLQQPQQVAASEESKTPAPLNDSVMGDGDDDDKIIDSIPQQMQRKAGFLLKALKNVMSWDDKGQISYRQESPVIGSNIVDLLGNVVRPKTLQRGIPKGNESFMRALNEVNVPLDWIRNKNVQSRMNKFTSTPQSRSPLHKGLTTTPRTPIRNRTLDEESGYMSTPSAFTTPLTGSVKKSAKRLKRPARSSWLTFPK